MKINDIFINKPITNIRKAKLSSDSEDSPQQDPHPQRKPSKKKHRPSPNHKIDILV